MTDPNLPTPKSAELVVLELRAKMASSEAEVARLRGLLMRSEVEFSSWVRMNDRIAALVDDIAAALSQTRKEGQ